MNRPIRIASKTLTPADIRLFCGRGTVAFIGVNPMQEVGLVDDATFAVDWVASRQQRRHLSRRALKRELEVKGVERGDIDRALENVDRDAELASARELVERKRPAMSALARDVQQRRLAGLLSRRGFDSAVITRVLSEVLRE